MASSPRIAYGACLIAIDGLLSPDCVWCLPVAGVSDESLHELLAGGVESIEREFATHGTPDDVECLEYILHHAAGSSPKVFPNGVRDLGRRGERLADFVAHPHARRSGLSTAHVLALRLYTSAAFRSLNAPLRARGREGAPRNLPPARDADARARESARACAVIGGSDWRQ